MIKKLKNVFSVFLGGLLIIGATHAAVSLNPLATKPSDAVTVKYENLLENGSTSFAKRMAAYRQLVGGTESTGENPKYLRFLVKSNKWPGLSKLDQNMKTDLGRKISSLYVKAVVTSGDTDDGSNDDNVDMDSYPADMTSEPSSIDYVLIETVIDDGGNNQTTPKKSARCIPNGIGVASCTCQQECTDDVCSCTATADNDAGYVMSRDASSGATQITKVFSASVNSTVLSPKAQPDIITVTQVKDNQNNAVCTASDKDNGTTFTAYVDCGFLDGGIPKTYKRRTLKVNTATAADIILPGMNQAKEFYISFYAKEIPDVISFDNIPNEAVFKLDGLFKGILNANNPQDPTGITGIFENTLGNGLDGYGKQYYEPDGNPTSQATYFSLRGNPNTGGSTNASTPLVVYLGWTGSGALADYTGDTDSTTGCPLYVNDDVDPDAPYDYLADETVTAYKYVGSANNNDFSGCGIIETYASGFCRLSKWNGKEYGAIYDTYNNKSYPFNPVVPCSKTDADVDKVINIHVENSTRFYPDISVGIKYGETLPSLAPIITLERYLSPQVSGLTGPIQQGNKIYWNNTGVTNTGDNNINGEDDISTLLTESWTGIPYLTATLDVSGVTVDGCLNEDKIKEIQKHQYGIANPDGFGGKSVKKKIIIDNGDENFLTVRECAYVLEEDIGNNKKVYYAYMPFGIYNVRYGIFDYKDEYNDNEDDFKTAFSNAMRNQTSNYSGTRVWIYPGNSIVIGDKHYHGGTGASIPLTIAKINNNGASQYTLPSLADLVSRMSCDDHDGWGDDCKGKVFKGIYGYTVSDNGTVDFDNGGTEYYDADGTPTAAATNITCDPNNKNICEIPLNLFMKWGDPE